MFDRKRIDLVGETAACMRTRVCESEVAPCGGFSANSVHYNRAQETMSKLRQKSFKESWRVGGREGGRRGEEYYLPCVVAYSTGSRAKLIKGQGDTSDSLLGKRPGRPSRP